MFPKSSKILLTGASGFVGSYILRKLITEGYQNIWCLQRSEPTSIVSNDITGVKWITGDILDICIVDELISDADIIIHAAALVSFDPRNTKKMINTAMEGTANLINAALSHHVSKFVHISSIAALGRKRKDETINENHIFSKSPYDTTYGLSKFLAEQEVWRGHAEGLNTTILNPSMILGAGNWDRSSLKVFKRIYHGLKYYPSGTTGWVDVRDVAESVIKCITPEHNGERYIISAENISYQSVFEKISSSLQVRAPQHCLTTTYSHILWRLEAIRAWLTNSKPIITKETIMSMSAISRYDNSKSLHDLKMIYKPVDITLKACCIAFSDTYPKGKNSGILCF